MDNDALIIGFNFDPKDPVLSGAEHVLFVSLSPNNGQTNRFICRQPGLDDERTLFMNSSEQQELLFMNRVRSWHGQN
jgi:hypothetical protein